KVQAENALRRLPAHAQGASAPKILSWKRPSASWKKRSVERATARPARPGSAHALMYAPQTPRPAAGSKRDKAGAPEEPVGPTTQAPGEAPPLLRSPSTTRP